MSDFKFPAEVIDLPSKGWFYPEGHPLATGRLDVYYMTAHHEDILTSRNLIEKGLVFDKLMEALIATPGVNYDDLLVGDKNGLMIASRILGYGKDYPVDIECPICETLIETNVNLEELKDKPVEFKPEQKGKNEFEFHLPISKKSVIFKLLNHRDEQNISKELDAIQEATGGDVSTEVTTRMRHAILAVDGDHSRDAVNKFVRTMLVRDARAFREYARSVTPDIDFTVPYTCPKCGRKSEVEVPVTANFFWPK